MWRSAFSCVRSARFRVGPPILCALVHGGFAILEPPHSPDRTRRAFSLGKSLRARQIQGHTGLAMGPQRGCRSRKCAVHLSRVATGGCYAYVLRLRTTPTYYAYVLRPRTTPTYYAYVLRITAVLYTLAQRFSSWNCMFFVNLVFLWILEKQLWPNPGILSRSTGRDKLE